MSTTAEADGVSVASLPTPYYQDDAVTIYCGDCREILPQLPKHDLLLTDPPYGIAELWDKPYVAKSGCSRLWGTESNSWDAFAPVELVQSSIGQCDKSIVWGGNYFPIWPSRGFLVWDKKQDFSGADSELAFVSWKMAPKTFRYSRVELANEGKSHPTQKPLPLIRWCLSFAPNAETILDPFAGSCTTGVAAKLEGRKATLIELEERYCEIGANRLSQGVLF